MLLSSEKNSRGSVLILVVVLLVLLALLGTAYITTSRNDRVSSAQNLLNGQVDAYAEGVAELAKSQIVASLFDPGAAPTVFTAGSYRPLVNDRGSWNTAASYLPGDMVTYNGVTWLSLQTQTGTAPAAGANWTTSFVRPFDAEGGNGDPWLASRVPTASGAIPVWQNISAPLLSGVNFEDPTTGQTWTQTTGLSPIASGIYPAFRNNDITSVAADARGDGIADSGLVRIPGAYTDGMTWYYGVNIVDNNATININTAAVRDTDPALSPSTDGTNHGYFLGNVGLDQLLLSSESINNLLNYRQGNAALNSSPIDDTNVARSDFTFISNGDVYQNQHARRLDNPGYAAVNTRFQTLPLSDSAVLAYRGGLINLNSSQSLTEKLLPVSTFNTAGTQPFLPGQGQQWLSTNYGYMLAAPTAPVAIRMLLSSRNPESNLIASPTPVLGAWNGSTSYSYGDVVTYKGLTYISVLGGAVNNTNVTPGTNTANWQVDTNGLTEAANFYMLPFSSVHYQGTWSSTATYKLGDIVLRNGYTYIAVATPASGLDPAPINNGYYTNFPTWQLQPWSAYPTKASINTATFRELWRAYWSCMAGVTPANASPMQPVSVYGTALPASQRQFRSPLRNPLGASGITLNGNLMAQLRSAIAAVNTIALRRGVTPATLSTYGTCDVISRTVPLQSTYSTAPAPATVYSAAPQPYITEVYVNTKNDASTAPAGTNPNGYVAIELFNPTTHDINVTNWQFGMLLRPVGGYPAMNVISVGSVQQAVSETVSATTPTPLTLIKAGQMLVFESYDPTAAGTYRPAYSVAAGNTTNSGMYPAAATGVGPAGFYSLPALTKAISANPAPGGPGELVLLRPRRADGQFSKCIADPLNVFDETSATNSNFLNDLVPVDSYDFTGINLTQTDNNYSWHYVRNNARTQAPSNTFSCYYPGPYDPTKGQGNTAPRHTAPTNSPTSVSGPWTAANGDPATTTFLAQGTPTYTFAFPPIGIEPLTLFTPVAAPGTSGNTFPFGGFARVGDVAAQVPFMGAYRICTSAQWAVGAASPATFQELNSLPMDSSMVDDQDSANASNDDSNEFLGQFNNPQTISPATGDNFYRWTNRIYQYLTVQAPADDYLPNVDNGPIEYTTPVSSYGTVAYPPALGNPPTTPATPQSPVYNFDATATDQTNEALLGVDGHVNINTACWKVLTALPLYPGNGANNDALAQAIVTYRTTNGPFHTIADLTNVPDPNNSNKPLSQDTTGILARISNLATTRSDSFTVYIVVQGWQNAVLPGQTAGTGANAPTLAVTRRYAFIVDRTGVTAASKALKITTVPND